MVCRRPSWLWWLGCHWHANWRWAGGRCSSESAGRRRARRWARLVRREGAGRWCVQRRTRLARGEGASRRRSWWRTRLARSESTSRRSAWRRTRLARRKSASRRRSWWWTRLACSENTGKRRAWRRTCLAHGESASRRPAWRWRWLLAGGNRPRGFHLLWCWKALSGLKTGKTHRAICCCGGWCANLMVLTIQRGIVRIRSPGHCWFRGAGGDSGGATDNGCSRDTGACTN